MDREEELLKLQNKLNMLHGLFIKYTDRKNRNTLYSLNDELPKLIILEYLSFIKTPYFELIKEYKQNYINAEAELEDNISKLEKKGLGDIYEYIKTFDYNKDKFDICITSMKIHMILYGHCNNSFGGQLRTNTAVLQGYYDVNVPDPYDSMKMFNSFINNSNFIFDKYNNKDIFGYIEDCVKLNVTLIKLQPFSDGNKRTFRALLNLLFKRFNIPPIYIDKSEYKEYENILHKALTAKSDDDFLPLTRFYLYKICDSIIKNVNIEKSVLNNVYDSDMTKKDLLAIAAEESAKKFQLMLELKKNYPDLI